MLLNVQHLYVSIENKEILKDFNFRANSGETHAFMGPNGAGKSTLAKVLAGHPTCEVISGSIKFEGQDIIDLEPEERAKMGMFMGFQDPVEIGGVTYAQFLYAAYLACKKEISEEEFDKILTQKMDHLFVDAELKNRSLNTGFSGGEKKRNEILQMKILEPKLAILDEIDSGLDIDAMKKIAETLKFSMNRTLLVITHNPRFLEYFKPQFVHVIVNGTIVESGGPALALKLEQQGYHGY